MSDFQKVVIDHGSAFLKAGLGGQDSPSVVLERTLGAVSPSAWITSDDTVRLWEGVFAELKVDPRECRVLMSAPPDSLATDRESAARIMFETLGVDGLSIVSSSVLALYSIGRSAGLVVESGEGSTSVMPVFQGMVMRATGRRLGVAGWHLTEYLMRLLGKQGCSFSSPADHPVVRRVKAACCYVADDFATEQLRASTGDMDRTHTLPDGQVLTLGSELTGCPEALFQPALVGVDGPGLPRLVLDVLNSCDLTIRSMLASTIMLSGGSTMFPGLARRLQYELTWLDGSNTFKVIDSREREYAAWIGGSIAASLSPVWMTRADYQEQGATGIHVVCAS